MTTEHQKTERYVVKKESGSQYAYVMDTARGVSIKRYDIFKPRNGWNLADKHCAALNAAIAKDGTRDIKP